MKTLNPFAATDIGIFRFHSDRLWVYLVELKDEPFQRKWAFPGTLVRDTEDLEAASKRAYLEATGEEEAYFEQVFTFSSLERDPRQRTISTAYIVLPRPECHFKPSPKYFSGEWFEVKRIPELAFDHLEILRVCHDRLTAKLNYTSIALLLLEQEFTLTDLQHLYEYCLGHSLDKRNFRKKILSQNLIEATDTKRTGERARPAMLYRALDRTMKIIPLFS